MSVSTLLAVGVVHVNIHSQALTQSVPVLTSDYYCVARRQGDKNFLVPDSLNNFNVSARFGFVAFNYHRTFRGDACVATFEGNPSVGIRILRICCDCCVL